MNGDATDGMSQDLLSLTHSKPQPLVCLAYGPTLAQRIADRQPVCSLNTPLQVFIENESRLETIENIARMCLDELYKIQPQGPYLIQGYCVHGIIAFEMAQQIIASGGQMQMLVLCDPAWLWPTRWQYIGDYVTFTTRRYWRRSRAILQATRNPLAVAGAAVKAVARRLSPAHPQAGHGTTPTPWHYIFECAKSYRPSPYQGPVSILVGGQERVGRASCSRWKRMCSGDVRVHVLNCSHLTMFDESCLGETAQGVLDSLAALP